MTTNDPDITTALTQLDRALESPRVLAAKAVAEYRGRVSGPVSNQHDDRGGRRLDVDDVVRASQPDYAAGSNRRRRRLLWWR